MMQRTHHILIIAVLLFLVAPLSLAQRAMGPGRRGMAGGRTSVYDTATVRTISGAIASVEQFSGRRGQTVGLHAVLKTDTGTVDVHLGPEWYLQQNKLTLATGDQITATGSELMLRGKLVLIAAEVKKGETVLKLRDERGVPLWSRRSR